MYPFFKRLFDMVAAAIVLIISAPLFLVLFVIVRLESPGRFIYAQTRSGRDGKPFKMYKIRTMRQDTPVCASNDLKKPYQYITGSGKVVRKLSIDELPQLFNILLGQMSFIGPRPVILQEEELIELRREKGALAARPGITGWAQVNGRDMMSIETKSDYDAEYAGKMSFKLDLKIMFMTIATIVTFKGYKEGARKEHEKKEEAAAAAPKFSVQTEVVKYQRNKA